MVQLVIAAAIALAAHADTVPLYNNLGTYHHAISTRVPLTQQYFDQGLRLAYAFNADEAIRSFREAARRDPKCAICWWGVAYAYGPNINFPMDSAANVAAADAIGKARALIANASPRERAYIVALAKRYGRAAGPAGDSAYMRGMQAVAQSYPTDIDALTLSAEARMLLRPWNYWQANGTPYPGTTTIVATLERALAANPNHPGACHYYIHALEAADAAKAVPCAERLPALMPGAGHLVHMPGHIYIRVGRWNDAIEANIHAVHADEALFAIEKPSGIYPLAYYPHNHHFLAFAANMAGRSRLALEHARAVHDNIPVDALQAFNIIQPLYVYPLLTMVTFGQWDALLAEPNPPAELRVATGLAAYAKGVAHAALGHREASQAMLDTLRAIAQASPESDGPVDKALDVALHALLGEMAYRTGNMADAEQHFRTALTIQRGMTYNEPPDWYYPMQQSLGLVLLQEGKLAEAEQLYREDLRLYPENVWSLTGLQQALAAQGKHEAARAVAARLAKAGANADVTIAKSRF